MKKILVVLLIAAFVGAFAFADGVSVGAWGRAGYAFINGSPVDSVATFPAWANGTRIGIAVHGSSPNVGFDLNIDGNPGAQEFKVLGNKTSEPVNISVGDNARVWVKIADFLRVDIGKAQIDNLRGKIGNDWASCLPSYIFNEFGDEDKIFTRFYPGQGIALSVTPVEGLFIGAAIDSDDKGGAGLTIASTLAGAQIGAGYTIKDIGQIRAQFIGNGDINSGKQSIQAAFALTAVKDLTVDVGTTIPLGPSGRSSVLLAAALSSSGFGLTTRIDLEIGQLFGLGAYVDAGYNISGPFTAGLKVNFDGTSDVSKTGSIGFNPYVKLGYSNGMIAMGFTYIIDVSSSNAGGAKWAIPVAAEYWF